MATNKKKHAFWLTPEAKTMVEEDARVDNCGSQSEFVEKAIRFYDGYLHTSRASAFLPKVLLDVLEGSLGVYCGRVGKLLFNLAVEHSITNHLLAEDADMDVLDPEHSGINLFDENWKIYSRNSGHTGHFIGNNAEVTDSMITDGCVVKGTVKHSILFGGVIVEEGAVVEDAVVMGDTVIKRGAKVTHCIVAEGVTVGCDAVIGEKPAEDVTGDVATIAPGVTIGDRAVIGPKAMVYNDVEEGQEQC